jgi:hypothetical protein
VILNLLRRKFLFEAKFLCSVTVAIFMCFCPCILYICSCFIIFFRISVKLLPPRVLHLKFVQEFLINTKVERMLQVSVKRTSSSDIETRPGG